LDYKLGVLREEKIHLNPLLIHHRMILTLLAVRVSTFASGRSMAAVSLRRGKLLFIHPENSKKLDKKQQSRFGKLFRVYSPFWR